MTLSPSTDHRFTRLFAEHRDAIWSYCYRRVEPDDVADSVAEVFLVAWRKIEKMPSDDEVILWLYGVARNVLRNARRSQVRRFRLNERLAATAEDQPESPEAIVMKKDEDRELLEAIDRLRPTDRELLRLRTWEELSLDEIAEVVGLSARAVESRLARVRKHLGRALSNSTNSMWLSPARRPGGER